MYAPHASPGRARLAAPYFPRLPRSGADDPSSDFGIGLPIAGAVLAIVAFLVAYRLLRSQPLGVLLGLATGGASSGSRSNAWFGVGAGLVGLTALTLTGEWGGLPGQTMVAALVVGSLAAGTAFLPALLLLPGTSPGAPRPSARALDGAIVGLALMFCGWATSPGASAGSVMFWVVMFHCCLVAEVAVTIVDASPRAARLRVPVVAVPVALALLLALVRLAIGAPIDRSAGFIGVLAAVAVGLRHLLPAPTAQAAERSVGDVAPGATGAPSPAAEHRGGLAAAITTMREVPRAPGALLLVGVEASAPFRDGVRNEAARRVREVVGDTQPDGAAVAWIDDDIAVLTGANVLQAYGLAHRLARAVGETDVPVCVGLTDIAAESTDEVLRRAVLALRRARQLGPGRVEWYDASVEQEAARVQAIESALPGALRRGELDLMYQPIVDLARDRPSGVEALLRWRHPTLGTLLPNEVIPVAVRTGTIGEIGHWVYRKATAQLASWRRSGRDLSMAVNVTPAELGGLRTELVTMLAAYRVPADRLVLEIAESRIEDGAALAEHAGALRSAGVRTALDAFGAEPASLAHLRRLPIDMVKLGQSFFGDGRPRVPAPRRPAETAHVVDLLVGVGRRLGVEVVAHGLEAPEQLEVARRAGCRMGQGHLFARPQPAERTEAYLDGFR